MLFFFLIDEEKMSSCEKIGPFRSTETSTNIAKSAAVNIPAITVAYGRTIETCCDELTSKVAQSVGPIFQFDDDVPEVRPQPKPLAEYNRPVTPVVVYRPALEFALPASLLSIYEKCEKNFTLLLQSPEILSEFFTKLLEESDNEVINKILDYFESEKYSSALSLRISPRSNTDFVQLIKRIAIKFPRIEGLRLYNKHITQPKLAEILKCTCALIYLHIEGCRELTSINGTTFPKSLREIELTGSSLDDSALVTLLTDTTLYLDSICISNCSKIEFANLQTVPPHSSITTLQIVQTDIGDDAIATVSRLFPGLEFLSLMGCQKISDSGFLQLRCTYLKSLDLSETEIGDAALQKLLDSLAHLEELSVASCPKLSCNAFYSMNTTSSLLTLIADDSPIDDKALRKIFENSPKLDHLSLKGCQNISRANFVVMPFPKTLKVVELEDTLIDSAGLFQLLTRAEGIEQASFCSCENLPDRCRVNNKSGQFLQKILSTPIKSLPEPVSYDDDPSSPSTSDDNLFHCE